jgi:hypothetical protein
MHWHVPTETWRSGEIEIAFRVVSLKSMCQWAKTKSQKENVTYQLGTYLMANEAWDSATLEAVRTPSLRTGQGRYSEEDPEEYEERVYGDIVSRPGHYFLGWDRKTRTYGVKFWRSEFDLDEIFSTYVHVLRELKNTLEHGAWYGNNLACHVPTPCLYLPIKRSGVVSEEIYERREKSIERR